MSFQSNVPDINIHTANIQPVTKTSTADAIGAIGSFAGEAIKARQTSETARQIQGLAEVTQSMENVLAEHGELGTEAFTPEGQLITDGLSDELNQQLERIQGEAGDRFKTIAAAVSQGTMPRHAAALYADKTIRELVNQTPGFSAEIRELARELLGYDPTGFGIRQVFDMSPGAEPAMTPTEKAWAEAERVSAGLAEMGQDVPPSVIFGMNSLQEFEELQGKIADQRLNMNVIGMNEWFQEVVADRGPDLIGTLSEVGRITAEEGGIASTERYVNAVMMQKERDRQKVRQRIATLGGIPTTETARYMAEIDDMYDPIIRAIEDNELGEIMARDLRVMAQLNELYGRQLTPKLMGILDAYPTVAPEIFNLLVNVADPRMANLIYPPGSPVREIIDAYDLFGTKTALPDKTVELLERTKRGELTAEDIQVLPVVEAPLMRARDQKTKPLRSEYLKSLAENGADIRATSLVATSVPYADATEDERRLMIQSFQRYVGSPGQEEVPGNLITMVADELLNLDPSLITQDLRLMTHERDESVRRRLMGLGGRDIELESPKLSVRGRFYGGIEREFQSPAMKKLQVFLDAVQANTWAPAFGVNPETFGQDILDRINNRVQELQLGEQEEQERTTAARIGTMEHVRSPRPSPQQEQVAGIRSFFRGVGEEWRRTMAGASPARQAEAAQRQPISDARITGASLEQVQMIRDRGITINLFNDDGNSFMAQEGLSSLMRLENTNGAGFDTEDGLWKPYRGTLVTDQEFASYNIGPGIKARSQKELDRWERGLTPEEMADLIEQRLPEYSRLASRTYGEGWDDLPGPAQWAMMYAQWQTKGGLAGFPAAMQAAREGRWEDFIREVSERDGGHDSRVSRILQEVLNAYLGGV